MVILLPKMIKKINIFDFIAIISCVIFTTAGILVSLNRFWQYETFYYDFGIFDQAIWKVAHLSPPIIDHFVRGGKWIFADHFNPGIFILSPFYLITERSEMLLIIQALAVGLSGFILYLIGVKVLTNRFISMGIVIIYLSFVGLQNAVISDFHEVTVAVLPLMLSYLMLIKNKIKLYLLFLLLTLGFKESNAFLGFGVGISLILLNKKWLKIGFLTCFISLIWGFLSIKIIISYFSQSGYQYTESFSLDPTVVLSNLGSNLPIKINTVFYSFLSFGFLPIFAPSFWLTIIQDFLLRFYSPFGLTRINLGLHYSVLLSAIMGVSSVFGLNFLKSKIQNRLFTNILVLLLILNAFILYRFIFHAPFGLAYNNAFYNHTKDFVFLDNLVSKVPKNASVMTQNNLAVRFTHQQAWLLRTDYKKFNPDYIVIDARLGQNPNNFFGENNFDIQKFIERLKKDPCYKIKFSTSEQYIFEKKVLNSSKCFSF